MATVRAIRSGIHRTVSARTDSSLVGRPLSSSGNGWPDVQKSRPRVQTQGKRIKGAGRRETDAHRPMREYSQVLVE